jgi:hypothetical protein
MPALRARLAHRFAAAILTACLAGMLASGLAAGPAAAQERQSEAAVKAAYLYRFLPFVEWPPAALPAVGAPFVIGVFASDAVAEQLPHIVVGRQAHGRPVVSRVVHEGDRIEDLHALFIGRLPGRSRLSEALKTRPVLTVTDQGLDSGAMINLLVVDGRVRFEAAPPQAERVGLKLGARLLAIADNVVR